MSERYDHSLDEQYRTMLDRARELGCVVPDSITCPECGMTSYHPEDVRQGYCGNCHEFTTPRNGD